MASTFNFSLNQSSVIEANRDIHFRSREPPNLVKSEPRNVDVEENRHFTVILLKTQAFGVLFQLIDRVSRLINGPKYINQIADINLFYSFTQ
jgi:hypothetical protein